MHSHRTWWRCALRTGSPSLSDLVRSSLRLRPDRIPIGEVRGAEALDLLKAWGTGHPGGDRHHPCRVGTRRTASPGATHPGSGRHRAARPHRGDDRPDCCARRSRPRAATCRTRRNRRTRVERRLRSSYPQHPVLSRGREGMTRSLAHVRHCVATVACCLAARIRDHTGSRRWFEYAVGSNRCNRSCSRSKAQWRRSWR